MKKYRNAITYGTFDLLHIGHINLLRRIKEIADFLTVGVCSDHFCATKIYKKYPVYSTIERFEIISSIKYVDKAIIEDGPDQKIPDILKYDIDLFVVGDDWLGYFEYLKPYCEVLYFDRTPRISSSMTKKKIMSIK